MSNEQLFAALGIVIVAVQAASVFYLARLNSTLQHKVNRLSTELSQRIKRLYRMRMLTNKIHSQIIYSTALLAQGGNPSLSMEVFAQGAADLSVQSTELMALAQVIGDPVLITAIDALDFPAVENHDTQKIIEHGGRIGALAHTIHVRIIELLEAATQNERR